MPSQLRGQPVHQSSRCSSRAASTSFQMAARSRPGRLRAPPAGPPAASNVFDFNKCCKITIYLQHSASIQAEIEPSEGILVYFLITRSLKYK